MKKYCFVVLTGLFMLGCTTGTTRTTRTATPANVKDNDVWEEVQSSTVEPEDTCTRCNVVNQQKEMQEIIQKIIEKGESIPTSSFQPSSL